MGLGNAIARWHTGVMRARSEQLWGRPWGRWWAVQWEHVSEVLSDGESVCGLERKTAAESELLSASALASFVSQSLKSARKSVPQKDGQSA